MILLEELKVYQLAMNVGEPVFDITVKWNILIKRV